MDQKAFALLYADLDGFKRINDEHGHLMGDNVLMQAAEILRATLRDGIPPAGSAATNS